MERIDLYQIHRPDLYVHPAELAGTLDRLRREGKIGEVGVSNHTPAQVDALRAHLPFPIASNQPEFSAGCLAPVRDGTLDQCMQHGTTPLAWSPLAGGRRRGHDHRAHEDHPHRLKPDHDGGDRVARDAEHEGRHPRSGQG